jgi:hypothetical protein
MAKRQRELDQKDRARERASRRADRKVRAQERAARGEVGAPIEELVAATPDDEAAAPEGAADESPPVESGVEPAPADERPA